MLTREEAKWSLKAFQILSILNILPIQVDVENGRIQRQTNPVRVFMWKILFGVGVSHWFYIFGRLVQSTILEPEKYFRWDHFVLHFGLAGYYAVFYFTGFCLFVKNSEENVIIFNQLLVQREDPVQKMIDQSKQLEIKSKSGNGNGIGKKGSKTRGKSGVQQETTFGIESHEESTTRKVIEVIEKLAKSNSESRGCPPPRPLLTWPLKYSLGELIAKLHPLVIAYTVPSVLLILAIDPSRPQLLFSSLPPEYQNAWSFLSLLAVETFCLSIPFYTSAFAVVIQVLFFGNCQLEFKKMSFQLRNLDEKVRNRSLETGNWNGVRQLKQEIWILRQILEEIRELVVLIELFNRCFPFCIFAWKICSVSLAIVGYFFVIRHFPDFPVFAVFIGYCATAMTLFYTIMYSNAFSIPGKMEELKNQLLLAAQKTTNPNGNNTVLAEMKREMKKIRGVGIKVGGFHQMERESTPSFVDFVVNQVVSLLVTFP